MWAVLALKREKSPRVLSTGTNFPEQNRSTRDFFHEQFVNEGALDPHLLSSMPGMKEREETQHEHGKRGLGSQVDKGNRG